MTGLENKELVPCEARQSGDVIISEKVNESRILTGERDNVLQLLSQTGLHLCRFDMLGDHYVAHVQKDQFCQGRRTYFSFPAQVSNKSSFIQGLY